MKDHKQNTFPLLQTVQGLVLHHNATDICVKSISTLMFRFLIRRKYIRDSQIKWEGVISTVHVLYCEKLQGAWTEIGVVKDKNVNTWKSNLKRRS